MKKLFTLAATAFLTLALCAQDHPRLFLSDDDFDRIKEIAEGDAYSHAEEGINGHVDKGVYAAVIPSLHRLIMDRAASVGLNSVPISYELDANGKRLLDKSREALERILLCSYAYRYSGEKKYLDHAVSDLETVCSFPSWNAENHFLDAAEMTLAVAIGYDWLYQYLSYETRAAAAAAIARNALEPSSDEDVAWFYYADGNWNQVCNACLAAGVLATCKPSDSSFNEIMESAVWSNRIAMETIYSPDGCYTEGPGYWNYGTLFQVLLLTELEQAFGEDFGLSDIKGFNETARYKLLTYRPFGDKENKIGNIFNYSDNLDEARPSYALWYFADRQHDPSLIRSEIEFLLNGEYENSSEVRLLPLLMTYALRISGEAPVTADNAGEIYISKGRPGDLSDTPLMIVRGNSDEPEQDFYLGIKGGSPSANHAHMDGGSFVYDAYGKCWIADPNRGDYASMEAACKMAGGDFWDMSQESLRWQLPCMGNLGHSTVTINGKAFNVKGKAEIVEVYDHGALLDLTSLYYGEKVSRRIDVAADGSLTIEDRIKADGQKCEVRISFATPAKVTVDKKAIFLERDGVRVSLSTKSKMRLQYQKFSASGAFFESDKISLCGFTSVIPAGKEAVFRTEINKAKSQE